MFDQQEVVLEILERNSETESDREDYILGCADIDTSDIQNVCLNSISAESEDFLGGFDEGNFISDRLDTANVYVDNGTDFDRDMNESEEITFEDNFRTTAENFENSEEANNNNNKTIYESPESLKADLNDKNVEDSNQAEEVASHIIQIVLENVFLSSASNTKDCSKSLVNLKRKSAKFQYNYFPLKQTRMEETIENIEEFIQDANNNIKTPPSLSKALPIQEAVSMTNPAPGIKLLSTPEVSKIDQ